MPEPLLTDANPLPGGLPSDLRRQLEFVIEVDQMKAVIRESVIASAPRRENDAEHSWHLFPLLPGDQGAQLRGAWEEFEAHATPEARFARSLDRLQPLLLEWMNEGRRWRETDTTGDGIRSRLGIIADGSTTLWSAVEALIGGAEQRGWLPAGGEPGGAPAGK